MAGKKGLGGGEDDWLTKALLIEDLLTGDGLNWQPEEWLTEWLEEGWSIEEDNGWLKRIVASRTGMFNRREAVSRRGHQLTEEAVVDRGQDAKICWRKWLIVVFSRGIDWWKCLTDAVDRSV
jgi:hypothetical protein